MQSKLVQQLEETTVSVQTINKNSFVLLKCLLQLMTRSPTERSFPVAKDFFSNSKFLQDRDFALSF